MSRKRYRESQIHRVLGEYENGASIHDLVTKYGISQATFYNWKNKFRGLSLIEITKLNQLEEENDKLKRMFADLSLENMTLKRTLEKIDFKGY